jgi:protein-glutamine gamma-glutamyltransferase
MNDYLPRVTLLRLLGVLGLVLLPHVLHLPAWESLLVAALIGWRAGTALREWPLPPPLLRGLLTLLAAACVFLTYGRFNGQQPGTALLVLMTALKLLEMRARRDVMVVVFLMYFLLLTHFLYAQELWTLLWLLACTVAITALLIECHHPAEPLAPRRTLRMGAVMVAQALPVMLVLFVLFPRIPGPLWGLPSDSGAARSGIPDSMAPGDISDLILSDAAAFRVRFLNGEAPPMRQRYWRATVFDSFDGRTWEAGFRPELAPELRSEASFRGDGLRYEIAMEPHRARWLFALEMPDPRALPPQVRMGWAFQLLAAQPVRERLLYELYSHPQYKVQSSELPPWQRAGALRLPPGFNPRTRELAQRWRAQGLDDAELIQRALTYFRNEPFEYTLQAPTLGRDSVDEFLFETRSGFCEHYASSFTVLMRAAGIPARIVAGYMGGEKNEFGDYYVIHQADAHAWTEVWLPGEGWVRVDPTAAVSPERIEQGLTRALRESGTLPDYLMRRGSFDLLESLTARWDWVNTQWNRWVLAYGPDVQREVLSRLGIQDWTRMVLWLTGLITGLLGLLSLWLLYSLRSDRPRDAAQRAWRRAERYLARRRLIRRPHEGPQDFVRRASLEDPELRAPLQVLLDAYLAARYLHDPSPQLQRQLDAAVRALGR